VQTQDESPVRGTPRERRHAQVRQADIQDFRFRNAVTGVARMLDSRWHRRSGHRCRFVDPRRRRRRGRIGLGGQVDASYTALIDNESLEFNLAYMADIEATFTPFFGMLLNNEKALFRGGADPVASLFVWHFMEEIEHRSSAIGIYNTVVASPWYRVRSLPKVIKHINRLLDLTITTLATHVPMEDRGNVSGKATNFRSPAFTSIPRREMASMIYRLALTQAPFHRPEHQPIPAFAADWLDAEASGTDITTLYAAT
jgi:predicted metal-dependent hydrolase